MSFPNALIGNLVLPYLDPRLIRSGVTMPYYTRITFLSSAAFAFRAALRTISGRAG